MSSNFPHRFVDGTNASIAVSYNAGGTAHFDCANPDGTGGSSIDSGLLSDGDPDNDGPRWAGYGLDHYYAQDEWSYVVDQHIDLEGYTPRETFLTLTLMTCQSRSFTSSAPMP